MNDPKKSEGNEIYDKYIKKPGYHIVCLKRDFPKYPDSMTVEFLIDVSIDIYKDHFETVDIVLVGPDHFSSLISTILSIRGETLIPEKSPLDCVALALAGGMAKVYVASEVANFEAVFINEGKGMSFLVLDI